MDPDDSVRAASCHALAFIGARSATPLLIANLDHANPRVQNASREALSRLWGAEERPVAFDTAGEWARFWQDNKSGVQGALMPGEVRPLVKEGARFEDE